VHRCSSQARQTSSTPQARDLRPPRPSEITPAAITDLTTAKIRRRWVLGGLINEYVQAA